MLRISHNSSKLEKVAINDTLPFKATWRDTIAKLKSFWGFKYDLRTSPMPFLLDFAVGATLMLLRVRWTGNGKEYWGWMQTPVRF